ncbi:GntR family transcriptional regulator [Jiangella asiatica]|uniref:GntR family transcriptional regulator n=1 Tax=Jiangella asiatica TaxID=2530372 RepID=A0A4R5DFB3_9ACTN|nr:GntR family transcriptional regulator [Jiangella asiatica]TDE11867.1 GntR family transcriptional regulator [Jiangella asiatica]
MAPSHQLPYRTKTELVYEHLRERILAGQPAPGERLVLDQVAADLGISKVPVREAVTRLLGEGWLENRPHAGPVVPVLSPAEVVETAVIRAALETAAIEAAIPRHDERSVAAMREILTEMEIADEEAEFPRLNVRLHTAVIEPCGLPRLLEMTVSLMHRTFRYQTIHRVGGYRQLAHSEHVAIVDAVTARDVERATALTRRHIVEAAERLATALRGEA